MTALVVCVRDVAGGEDQYVGPFYSDAAARAMHDKIVRHLIREDCYGQSSVDVLIEEITPARELAAGDMDVTPTLAGVPIADDDARELSRAARMTDTWRHNRDRLIREAHRKGGGLREIGRLVGMTHRAVSKIVAKGDSER